MFSKSLSWRRVDYLWLHFRLALAGVITPISMAHKILGVLWHISWVVKLSKKTESETACSEVYSLHRQPLDWNETMAQLHVPMMTYSSTWNESIVMKTQNLKCFPVQHQFSCPTSGLLIFLSREYLRMYWSCYQIFDLLLIGTINIKYIAQFLS